MIDKLKVRLPEFGACKTIRDTLLKNLIHTEMAEDASVNDPRHFEPTVWVDDKPVAGYFYGGGWEELANSLVHDISVAKQQFTNGRNTVWFVEICFFDSITRVTKELRIFVFEGDCVKLQAGKVILQLEG